MPNFTQSQLFLNNGKAFGRCMFGPNGGFQGFGIGMQRISHILESRKYCAAISKTGSTVIRKSGWEVLSRGVLLWFLI
jgi:hypothetical protein